jgi:hypothetical protein
MTLHEKQRITHVKIDELMAMTHRYELEVIKPLTPERRGYANRETRVAIIRQRGKRKQYYLDLRDDSLLFDGWGAPFKADTECNGVMHGNACYNLVGEAGAIRDWVENRALWPVQDETKAKILVCQQSGEFNYNPPQQLLYPDIETGHAVICRMKEAQDL